MGKRISSGTVSRLAISLRSSFWFLPAMMVSAAIALALALVALDRALGTAPAERLPWLFTLDADGAREVLATIAGSMITVAGVVFSITIAALAQAATQYTSRVLRNFMRDRGNQVVLGVFVGVFAYCLAVLRTVTANGDDAFVPQVATTTGVLLALVAVGFLVFFIHHIAASVQSGEIARRIAAGTLEAIENVYPDPLEGDESPVDRHPGDLEWYPVTATGTGYLESVDHGALLDFARAHDVVVRMDAKVGEFAAPDRRLASIGATREPDARAMRDLACLFAVDSYRTIDQDVAFGIRQLVDVALKALSPAINDSTSAVTSLDYISLLLRRLAVRRIEPRPLYDGDTLRVLPAGPSFERLVALAFEQILENAEGNTTVLLRMLRAVDQVHGVTRSPARRQVLEDMRAVVAEVARGTARNSRARRLLETQLKGPASDEDTGGA